VRVVLTRSEWRALKRAQRSGDDDAVRNLLSVIAPELMASAPDMIVEIIGKIDDGARGATGASSGSDSGSGSTSGGSSGSEGGTSGGSASSTEGYGNTSAGSGDDHGSDGSTKGGGTTEDGGSGSETGTGASTVTPTPASSSVGIPATGRLPALR
jgi:hypothetical protein